MEFQPRTRSLLLLLGLSLSLVLHSCNKNEYNKGDFVSENNLSSPPPQTLAAGGSHTCAVLSGGTVKCWGYGANGQLVNGGTSDQSTPVAVSNISNATTVSAGGVSSYGHTCAVISGPPEGTVYCWGSGAQGQLGHSQYSSSTTPVVSFGGRTTAVSAGESTSYGHTCAVLSGGTVECWGTGASGRLGNNSDSNQSTPVTVSNISSATEVSAGGDHSCAELSGGTVQCWGAGGAGRLGNGSDTSTSTPVTVSGL